MAWIPASAGMAFLRSDENLTNNANNRVVVTGLGIISALGLDTASSWQALIAGKSGVDNITLFDASKFGTRFAG